MAELKPSLHQARPYLCCWRCHSQSPVLHSKLWLCWRPGQRKGWAGGSVPRARAALALEEQFKWRYRANDHIVKFTRFPPWGVAHRHHGEDTDFPRGLWPMTRPLLRHSRRTPPHCFYPAAPRSPLSWPPDAQTTLFIRTHSHWTLCHTHSHTQPLTIRKNSYILTHVITAQTKLRHKLWTADHEHAFIRFTQTKPTAVDHMTLILCISRYCGTNWYKTY